MSDWLERELGQVCTTLRAGGTPTSDNPDFYGGDIPFVTIEDISRSGRTIERTSKSLTPIGLASSAAWLVPSGHLLFSMYATLGKTTVNLVPVATNQAILAIKPNHQILDDTFLHHLLEWLRPSVSRMAAQTTQANLSADRVRRMPIRFPRSLNLQRRIAEILSTVDEAIEQTEALIAKTQQIKAGLMHDLFTRGVTPDGHLRPPREEAPNLYKESPLGWVPKEWEVARLDEVATVTDPNPSHRNPIYTDWGYPFISTVEFIQPDEIETNTNRRVSLETVEEQENRCSFGENSIAFSRKGTIGSIRFLPTDIRFALLDSLCVINPGPRLPPQFVYYSLRSDLLRRQIANSTLGVALQQVSIGRVRDLLMPVPRGEEPGKIAALISQTYTKERSEMVEVEKLLALKSGLMQDLLTGRVQVPVRAEDAASV